MSHCLVISLSVIIALGSHLTTKTVTMPKDNGPPTHNRDPSPYKQPNATTMVEKPQVRLFLARKKKASSAHM